MSLSWITEQVQLMLILSKEEGLWQCLHWFHLSITPNTPLLVNAEQILLSSNTTKQTLCSWGRGEANISSGEMKKTGHFRCLARIIWDPTTSWKTGFVSIKKTPVITLPINYEWVIFAFCCVQDLEIAWNKRKIDSKLLLFICLSIEDHSDMGH